jgi:hypothetical protein
MGGEKFELVVRRAMMSERVLRMRLLLFGDGAEAFLAVL